MKRKGGIRQEADWQAKLVMFRAIIFVQVSSFRIKTPHWSYIGWQIAYRVKLSLGNKSVFAFTPRCAPAMTVIHHVLLTVKQTIWKKCLGIKKILIEVKQINYLSKMVEMEHFLSDHLGYGLLVYFWTIPVKADRGRKDREFGKSGSFKVLLYTVLSNKKPFELHDLSNYPFQLHVRPGWD